MRTSEMNMGRAFGIEIRASRSWLVVFVFFTISMALQFGQRSSAGSGVALLAGLAASTLLFASVLLHELAHCFAARLFGIEAKSVTLNFFGGMSSLGREAAKPVEDFVIAVSGPLVNVVIAAVGLVVGLAIGDRESLVGQVVEMIAGLNAALAVFNLAPGLPLDGGRALRAVVWWMTKSYERATRIAATAGQGLAALCLMGGLAMLFAGNGNGLILAIVGLYLYTRARASKTDAHVRAALEGLTVASMWLDTLPNVERSATIADFFRDAGPAIDASTDPHFMVVDDGVIYGLVAFSQAARVDRQRWETTSIGDVMVPIARFETLTFQTDIVRALEAMTRSDIGELPVVENNAVQGFVGRESLVRFVTSRIAAQNG